MKIEIPEQLALTLTQILLSDEKAKLLLQGFIAGKGLEGNIKVTGCFNVETQD